MKNKLILFISPIIILAEIMIFSFITELLRQPHDLAVLSGVILISIALISNYFLIKFIQKN